MPTDEWFKENPKVSAYIPKELNEKLLEWMQSRNVKKVSQALTTILEEHLGVAQKVVQTELPTQPVNDDRLETLEQKFENLSQIVQEMREAIQANSLQVVQTEPIQETLPLLDAIAAIEMERSSHPSVEEEQDDEPDEILYDFLEPEKSSLPVEESGSKLENQETQLPDTMSSHEVAKFLGSTYNAVGKRHREGKVLEAKGYKLTPKKQGKNQVWVVEPL